MVVKHKNGHLPGLVKNLMQIGRKDNKDDLYMLAFEVEFVVSSFYNLFLHFDLMIQVVENHGVHDHPDNCTCSQVQP